MSVMCSCKNSCTVLNVSISQYTKYFAYENIPPYSTSLMRMELAYGTEERLMSKIVHTQHIMCEMRECVPGMNLSGIASQFAMQNLSFAMRN